MKIIARKVAFVFTPMLVILFTLIMCSDPCDKCDDPKVECEKEHCEEPKVGPMLPLINTSVGYLDTIFSEAMLDARNPEPNEIYTKLVSLKNNPDLIDTMINGELHIKMVSWKRDPTPYEKKSKVINTQKWPIWVTAAPAIKDSCISFYKKEKNPNMRLRQLLGLQPFTIETVFVEFWVKPADMFRPCPDKQTDDCQCDLNLPKNVSSDYREWFNEIRAVQYNDCTDNTFHQYGYPWTQLGYTYDWNPKNKSHVGLSEFVIPENTEVHVGNIYTTKQYSEMKPGK